jgi:hypothetical protein
MGGEYTFGKTVADTKELTIRIRNMGMENTSGRMDGVFKVNGSTVSARERVFSGVRTVRLVKACGVTTSGQTGWASSQTCSWRTTPR